jgi:ketosteroid isomerase-like protein
VGEGDPAALAARLGKEGAEIALPVLRSYEALNRGDVDGAVDALAVDVVWRESAELPGGGELRGREAVREFLLEFLETWETFDQRVDDVNVRGDRLLAVISMRGVGRGSGAEVATAYAHLWTVRGGRGVRVDAYRDVEAARAAIEP